MRFASVGVVVFAFVVGFAAACGGSSDGDDQPPGPHPLDAVDPMQGPFADTLGVTTQLLGVAQQQLVLDPDRVVSTVDPLGIHAMLGHGQAAANFTTPALNDLVQQQPVLAKLDLFGGSGGVIQPCGLTAMRRWAAIASAHTALKLANVLDALGQLDAQERALVRAAADAFAAAVSGAQAQSFDWKKLVPSAGYIQTQLATHATFAAPPEIVAVRALQITKVVGEMVVGEMGITGIIGEMGSQPVVGEMGRAPVPGTLAWQTVFALPLIRDFSANEAVIGEMIVGEMGSQAARSAYLASLVAAAQATLNNQVTPAMIGDALTKRAVIARAFSRYQRMIDAATSPALSLSDAVVEPSPAAPLVDPNAFELVPNIATAGAVTPFVRVQQLYSAEAWGDRPIPLRWSIASPRPIDHIDMRIRQGSTEVRHFIYRPTGGQIATRTSWLPTAEQRVALASTVVDFVVVDNFGGASHVSSNHLFSGFADPVDPRSPTHADFLLAENVIEIFDGDIQLATRQLAINAQTQFTIINHRSVPARIKSVYTPPYVELPFSTAADNTTGGIPPLDFGIVAPDMSLTMIVMPPASVPPGFQWTVGDFEQPLATDLVEVTARAP